MITLNDEGDDPHEYILLRILPLHLYRWQPAKPLSGLREAMPQW